MRNPIWPVLCTAAMTGLALTASADIGVGGGRTDFLTVSHPAAAERLALSAPVFEIDGQAVTAAVERDAKGRAILRCRFEKPSAAIVLFGGTR